ncbi:MAG: AAA family ATPase [Bacilli bacterium]|nr:AAA family ATPase [Bacilli bacterium]
MYTSSISLTSNEAIEDGILDKSIYEISDIEELDKVVAILNTNERFNARKINSNNINTASISNYRRFLDEYNIVDEKDNNVEWLLPANGEVYNHKESFEKNGCIDWRQTRNFAVNDIVYIYSTSPEKRISALTKVEKINILPNETIDDREFWNTNEKYNEDKDRYCRLRLINFIDNDKLSLDNLMKHGLNAAPQGAIKLTEELSSYIHSILDEDRSYSRDKFLNEVYIDGKLYDSMISILEKKKNIILEGAPGVGKTFMAKRLAYSIIGTKDEDKLCLIQFHQSYSYEDFIEGYRPTENGFELEHGIFYKFCKKAENDPDHDYYMIIDEINRGNLSKIFGELLMLIESDKRGEKLQLAYSEEEFSVPDNLYIIGLMNTADRSLALIDYALRRRFSFVRIEPAFDNDNFIRDFNNKFDADYSNIIKIIKDINEAIENDKSLGSGFKIGHSYFCPDIKDRKGNKKDLVDIITYEIKPLLEEYWYDDEDAIIQWESALDGVIDD